VTRKSVYLYVSHRFDFVFYARLVEALNSSSPELKFTLVLPYTFMQDDKIKSFVTTYFANYLLAPIYLSSSPDFFRSVWSLVCLRGWFNKFIDLQSLLVSTDKSSRFSRFFLKRSRHVLLLQQPEIAIDSRFQFDLFRTLSDFVKSYFIGSRFALFFTLKSSDRTIAALKLLGPRNSQHFQRLVMSHAQHTQLPPLSLSSSFYVPKFVFFGSRFLSWPYFNDKFLSNRLKVLASFFNFLASTYAGNDFIYLKHPLEQGDEFDFVRKSFDGKIDLVTSYFSSEHFLFSNRDVFMTCSIGSTSSASSYSMGFNTKVLYESLFFASDVKAIYSAILADLPLSSHVRTNADFSIQSSLNVSNQDNLLLHSFLS